MNLVYHHQEGLSQRVEIFLLQIEMKSALRYSTQCKAKRLLCSLSASQYESLWKQIQLDMKKHLHKGSRQYLNTVCLMFSLKKNPGIIVYIQGDINLYKNLWSCVAWFATVKVRQKKRLCEISYQLYQLCELSLISHVNLHLMI